jgi:hypothetical protein
MMRIDVPLGMAVLFVGAFGAACAQEKVLWALPNFSDRLEVEISNPGSDPVHTLAVVDTAKARAIAPGFPGTLAIVADQTGRTQYLPSQADAGDGGESSGDFVIAVDLPPRSQQILEIYYSSTLKQSLPWPKHVDATRSYGYNRATAALESELIGYRTYGGFYLDVQAHGKGQFGLFNSLIGFTSISSYAMEGEDVLHIGDTLGLGGLFLRTGTRVYRPPVNTPDYAHQAAKADEPTYRVLSNGPLRALVEADLPHWKIEGDEVALRAVYEMREGEENARCHVWIMPLHLTTSYEVGAGIRELPQMNTVEGPSLVAVDGVQEQSTGRIALGLAFNPDSEHRAGRLITPEGANQIVLSTDSLRPDHGVSLTYRAAAAWQGSGWTNPAQHVVEVLRETPQPMVNLLRHESIPNPERLTSEPR